MASSSDVKDTDEDKDKDDSNHSIARSFDEPSAENLERESDYLDNALHFDFLTSIIRFSDEGLSKGSCTMELFDSSSSVSLTSNDGAIYFS